MSSSRQAGAATLRAVERPKSEMLQKLTRGEVTLDEYLDEQAEQAMAHLKGKVAAHKLEDLRMVLREKLRTDPLLVELVRQATGRTPSPLADVENN